MSVLAEPPFCTPLSCSEVLNGIMQIRAICGFGKAGQWLLYVISPQGLVKPRWDRVVSQALTDDL